MFSAKSTGAGCEAVAYDARPMSEPLPYRIAVLCYLFDEQGRLLLLHRRRPPNQDLYSPIGGKLHMEDGESPGACALREIHEEAELELDMADLHLTGMVSERGFEGKGHWLLFLYEVTRPVTIERTEFEEGTLEWHPLDGVERLTIPETDRRIIYPLFRRYRGAFFHVHIECGDGSFDWRLEYPREDAEAELGSDGERSGA